MADSEGSKDIVCATALPVGQRGRSGLDGGGCGIFRGRFGGGQHLPNKRGR